VTQARQAGQLLEHGLQDEARRLRDAMGVFVQDAPSAP